MNKDALTAVEVAEMLNIAKNTVYVLVKRGELDCYMVGRKMRFTYDDVQKYINRSRSGKASEAKRPGKDVPGTGADALVNEMNLALETDDQESSDDASLVSPNVFRICGNDEILNHLARRMMEMVPGLKAECIHKGSYDALTMLYRDRVSAAASHMWDSETDSYNIPFVKAFLPGCQTVIIHICTRTEGLYVAEGNPKKIFTWEDLGREDIVMANREPGAGSRILTDVHLAQLGIDGHRIKGYDNARRTHLSVAGAVSKGEADVGVGPEKTALSTRGVTFVPLQEESYDLVIKESILETEAVQVMLKILRSFEFQEEFRYSSGYDIAGMGDIISK
ncbi:MAG: helix-turn-helix domain-containing protein [Lachnospiraceae bacterium]|nr:helix-turn-helix domain-containing protein [Lachnospiraceae bacterium]